MRFSPCGALRVFGQNGSFATEPPNAAVVTPEWPYLPASRYPRVGWPALGGRGNVVAVEARQVWRETPLEKKGEMDMRTRTAILFLTFVFVVFAAGYVSAQQALPGQDVKSLAGKWSGWMVPTTGGPNVPVEVQVEPDGSYTSTIGGSTMEKGTIKVEGGKLKSEGVLVSGTRTVMAGVGKSELTLTSKDGKQMITGFGRDDQGPYSFRLTKQ